MTNKQTPNNSIPETIKVEGLRLAFKEMQSLYTQRQENAANLDGKAETILGSASLILSLITTLQLILSGTDQPWFYWFGLIVVFLLYLGMIVTTLFALTPRAYATPIAASWEVLDRRLFQATEEKALLTLIKAYIDRVNEISPIIDKKANLVRRATVLLALIVCLLVILSMVIAK